MLDTQDTLTEVVAQVLETMAFISPLPPEGPAPGSGGALLASMEFTGAASGVLRLAAPRAFAVLLASNMLGACDEAEAQRRAEDAIKELTNVTCGTLLAKLASGAVDISLPRLADLDARGWQTFLSTPGTMVLDADGHAVAIHLRETSRMTPET